MKEIRNPWTNVYGTARSLLALCTLVALLADSTDLLFRPLGVEVTANRTSLMQYSLFSLLSGPWLPLAKAIAVTVLLLVLAGWRPRFTGIAHWWVTASFAASSLLVEGGDQVAAILALLLIPVTLTDPRPWHWGTSPVPLETTSRKVAALISSSCLVVIRLQVALIYFFACTAKLAVTEWINGTALYYWLINPTFGLSPSLRPIFLPLLRNPWGVTFMTWSVLVLEALLFMGLTMRPRYRPLLLKAGLLFHFGIVVFHGLFTFFLAMAAALILYLRQVDEPFQPVLAWMPDISRRERLPAGAPVALTPGV